MTPGNRPVTEPQCSRELVRRIEEMAKVEITPAPEAEKIARSLIIDYHPHLETVGIAYVFTTAVLRDGGKAAAAKVQRLTPLQRFLLSGSTVEGDEFLVSFDPDMWRNLTPTERAALVDHELMHLALDEPEEDGEPAGIILAPHDVAVFHDELRRYGAWEPSIAIAAKQLRLFEETEAREPVAAGVR